MTLRDVAVTTADRLYQEGWLEGFREGMLEAAMQAKRDVIRKLLVTRFGAVPGPVAARLDAAQDAELDVFGERVLTAASAEDVVRELP